MKLYQEVVDGVNGQLANFESVKRIYVVADEWTVESGQLTPSMKLKRRVIDANYAKEIAMLYADESNSRA